jgi:hypothetical protein
MSATPDIITQSVFIAALFLTFISVPKLAVLTAWYTGRIFSKRFDKWIIGGKIYRKLANENLITYLEEETKNPGEILLEKLDQWLELTDKIRDSTIESIVAIALLVIVYSVFPQILLWLIVSVHIIVGILVWTGVLWFHITYESKKLPSNLESKVYEDE